MTPEADDVDADIRAEQDMDLPSVSEWIEHGLAAAEDLSAAYHEGRDGPGGLNVGTMRAHIDAITAAFEAIRADTTRPSDTASLATTREACLHEDEDFGRGSAIVRVNDDRYECAVCGQRFRLVPGYAPWLYPVTSETALGLPDDWLNAAAGAALASALVAANYGGDSGEDVDRLVAELGKRGYVVVPEARPSDAASLAAALDCLGCGTSLAECRHFRRTHIACCPDCDHLAVRLHPGQHEFRTTCRLCDEDGHLFVAVITDHERVAITDARLAADTEAGSSAVDEAQQLRDWLRWARDKGFTGIPEPSIVDRILNKHRPAIEAAIRADTPTLDAGRLNEAAAGFQILEAPAGARYTGANTPCIRAIAAEYARLTADTEAGS